MKVYTEGCGMLSVPHEGTSYYKEIININCHFCYAKKFLHTIAGYEENSLPLTLCYEVFSFSLL
jgi:hypothetical protein